MVLYIIVDPNPDLYCVDYNINKLRPFVLQLTDLGHKVGLHSTAWSKENPLTALEIELDIFLLFDRQYFFK